MLNGKATKVMSFKKKDGSTFSAALILNKEHKITWAPFESKTDLTCPKCGKPLVKTPMSYKCDDDECGFIFWTKICGKTLTDTQVKKLLSGQSTGTIKGFKKKDGTSFNASLIMKDGKLEWEHSIAKDTGLKCPKCGKPIVATDKAFSCADKKDGKCDFQIWRMLPGDKVVLTEKDMKDLLEKKKTGLKKDLKSKGGNTFNANITLKDDFTRGMEFADTERKKKPQK